MFFSGNTVFVWFCRPGLTVCKEAWGPVKGIVPGRVLSCIWKNPSSEESLSKLSLALGFCLKIILLYNIDI